MPKIGLLKFNTSFGSSGAFLSKTDLGPPDKIIPAGLILKRSLRYLQICD